MENKMGFWTNTSGSTSLKDSFQSSIRTYLSQKFYLEGEQKDYYFGQSIIGGTFTIFYNNENMMRVIQ